LKGQADGPESVKDADEVGKQRHGTGRVRRNDYLNESRREFVVT
jgi:hypothetical protein